jgi:hypothetical protein
MRLTKWLLCCLHSCCVVCTPFASSCCVHSLPTRVVCTPYQLVLVMLVANPVTSMTAPTRYVATDGSHSCSRQVGLLNDIMAACIGDGLAEGIALSVLSSISFSRRCGWIISLGSYRYWGLEVCASVRVCECAESKLITWFIVQRTHSLTLSAPF